MGKGGRDREGSGARQVHLLWVESLSIHRFWERERSVRAWRTLTPVEGPAVTANCPHFLPGGHSRPGLESPCLTSRSAYPATCLATRQGVLLGLQPAVQGLGWWAAQAGSSS